MKGHEVPGAAYLGGSSTERLDAMELLAPALNVRAAVELVPWGLGCVAQDPVRKV